MSSANLLRVDRRRSTRVRAMAGLAVPLSAGHSVRILDLGLGGALVASRDPMPVGVRGRLTFALGSAQFKVDVKILRVDYSDPLIYYIGTAFVAMTDDQRESLLGLAQR